MIENQSENLEAVQKQFEIKHVIGRGTFGTVYFGYWKTKSLDVAIKIITRNPKYKNREVEILKSVQSCDSIVKLLMHFQKKDHENNKTQIYLIMEYLPTTLLSAVRLGQKNKIDYERVKDIMKKIFEGLAYLDEKNVCHRDIKPSNILYDQKDGRIKLCDFGSAKLIKKGQKSITYICSRYYRAPELILGCSQYSNKIDIWSAGCMITELLTMHPLFDGANNVDQMAKIIKVIGPPTKQDISAMKVDYIGETQQKIIPVGLAQKIRKLSNNCPNQFLDLIERLVVYDPNKRLSPKSVLEHQLFKQ